MGKIEGEDNMGRRSKFLWSRNLKKGIISESHVTDTVTILCNAEKNIEGSRTRRHHTI